MIDIHCHILPGVDDGSKTIEDSLEMAREAVADGIHTIVATPHHQNGIYTNWKDEIESAVNFLNSHIEKEHLDLTILPGSEIHAYNDLINDLKADKVLTFNDQKKYLFVEFPYDRVPVGAEKLLFDIQVAGYIPIIPHPERNKGFQEHPEKLYHLVKRGAMTQITASSLLGYFGKNVQSFAEELIEHNLTHMIASDSHGIGKRGVKLKEAYQRIEEKFSKEIVTCYQNNVTQIIKGKDIYLLHPSRIEKKKNIFGLFSRKTS